MSDVKRGADAQYATMSDEEVWSLPVAEIVAEDAVLALWVPASMLLSGLKVMHAWGFRQKTVYTWVKTTKNGNLAFGMGHTFRACTEIALIGTRGKPKNESKRHRNVSIDVGSKTGEIHTAELDFEFSENEGHSVKPDGLQAKLELMYPSAAKLEIFARRNRAGWDCTGLECPGTEGVDARDWLAEASKMLNGEAA